ncbi:MAG: LacI family DNA-binding transcriptional regulator [Holophagae bacterium]|nr:LacI family DNA-binding transcriptional regulator [Holophagae bacterium]
MKLSKRPVTIKDIARETGLSTCTVSCALRNRSEVSPATQELVHATAKEMGYQRNAAFAALGTMAHRNKNSYRGLPIGYLWQHRPIDVNFQDVSLLEGLQSKCLELGYHLEEFCLDDFRSNDHFLTLVVNRGLTGLIIGHLREEGILSAAPLQKIALVAAGYHRLNLPIYTVKNNAYEISFETLLNVYEKGYRKILVLQFWHENLPAKDDYLRYAGTMAASLKIGPLTNGWIKIADRPDGDVTEWKKVIDQYQPDAIIGFNDADYYFVDRAGFMKSTQHAFAARACSLNTSPFATTEVSGMVCHSKKIGETAVQWIDQLIRIGEWGIPPLVKSQVIQPEWREGTTTPTLPVS